MKIKNLIILVVLAIALTGLALLTSKNKDRETSVNIIGTSFLPGIDINETVRFTISSPTESATLIKCNGIWCLADNFNYPVDFERVREALLSLTKLKIGHVLKVDEKQRSALCLNTPPSPTAGTLVTLYNQQNTELASILIGRGREKTSNENQRFGDDFDGQYVARSKDSDVYLVDSAIHNFSGSARSWLNTSLISIEPDTITNLTISAPGKTDIVLAEADQGSLALKERSGNEDSNPEKIATLQASLAHLNFADVANPALTDAQLGMDKPFVFRTVTRKGEIYTVKLGGIDGNTSNRYVRISAEMTPPEEEPKTVPAETENKTSPPAEPATQNTQQVDNAALAQTNATVQTPPAPQPVNIEEENAKQAEEQARMAAKAERSASEERIKLLNEKANNWTYTIHSNIADMLLVTREDLTKKPDQKEENQATQ